MTDTLAESIQALTYSDYRGLMRLSTGRHDALHTWFLALSWAGMNSEPVPAFSCVGWQTFQVAQSLQMMGGLAGLAAKNNLPRLRTLCNALIDTLLADMQDRKSVSA